VNNYLPRASRRALDVLKGYSSAPKHGCFLASPPFFEGRPHSRDSAPVGWATQGQQASPRPGHVSASIYPSAISSARVEERGAEEVGSCGQCRSGRGEPSGQA